MKKRLLSLLLSLMMVLSICPLTASAEGKSLPMSDWMQSLPDEVSLGQVNLPGTHDSGTANVGLSREIWNTIWSVGKGYVPVLIPALAIVVPVLGALLLPLSFRLPSLVRGIVSGLGQCVEDDIAGQLNRGIRSMDLRLAYNFRTYDESFDPDAYTGADKLQQITDRLRLMHGSVAVLDAFKPFLSHDVPLAAGLKKDNTPLTLWNVLSDCRTFLSEHPTETVVLFYQYEGRLDKHKPDSGYNRMMDALLLLADATEDLQVVRSGGVLPTVGQARGKILLIASDDCNLLENHWDVSAQEKIAYVDACLRESETIPQDGTLQSILSGTITGTSPRLIYTSTYYNMRPNFFRIFFGGDPFDGTPKQLATEVNDYLSGYRFQKGQYYGWIYMNFPMESVLAAIVQSNDFAK